MPRVDREELPDDAPVFVISVAAELAGMHAQTLRQYDRLGLVTPGRTATISPPLAAAKIRDPSWARASVRSACDFRA